ncbi:type II toxin-antitoxin system VapC family toxin [soil metagenome]
MNGNKYLADTNILLYLIAGNSGVIDYLNDQFYISEITEIELLCSKGITELQYDSRKKVINSCTIISISENIKRLTIQLKQTYTLKIPDAIVAATSIYLNLPLLTADKDFKKIREVNLSIIQPH